MGLMTDGLPAYLTVASATFASSVVYSASFPSLQPFLSSLAKEPAHATSPLLGVAVAALSATKVLAAPYAGRATARFGVPYG